MQLDTKQALALARDAALGAGASLALAESLARATVAAELAGKSGVGFAHLLDYLDGLTCGRICKNPIPVISQPTPASIRVDAQGGIAQLGFDLAFEALQAKCRLYGMAVLVLNNSFTAGELGYYTRRLAQAGLVALASTNAEAQLTTPGAGKAVFGTNPLSFAAPRTGAQPLVIDQSSSATAFVNVRRAAEKGEAIPAGWALDQHGQPTTDARAALDGLLLPFGGARGANMALMVEVLTAGLAGGNWSTDAPSFASGSQSPAMGLFVVAFAPELLSPGFGERLDAQLAHLASQGVHIPGSQPHATQVDTAESTLEKLRSYLPHHED